jgi:general stress protein YciG
MAGNTSARGFASMDQEKQREIARKGGKAAHQKGTAHEFTSDEARAAGRKGGERVSANRAHMAEIGRLGGKRSASRRANPASRTAAPATNGNEARSETESDEGDSNSQQASHHGGGRDDSM